MDRLEQIIHREAELSRRFLKWHGRLTGKSIWQVIREKVEDMVFATRLMIAVGFDSFNNTAPKGLREGQWE